jgi:hypothetical protein
VPVADVANSTTVPAPQPLADIVPVSEGHILLTITIVGASGAVPQFAGTVLIAADAGLKIVASVLQT